MKNVKEMVLRRLENQVEEENVVEEAKEQINEGDFMEMIVNEINSKTLNIIGTFDIKMVEYVRNFVSQLWYYEQDDKRPLFINISSRGGEVDALFSILDMLEECKNEWGCTIITRCAGIAQSCGFALFCYGDVREMNKWGELMCHSISYGINHNLAGHEQELKRTKKVQQRLDRVITEKTPISQKQLNKWYKSGQDIFIDYEEAKKLGLLTMEEENEDEGNGEETK